MRELERDQRFLASGSGKWVGLQMGGGLRIVHMDTRLTYESKQKQRDRIRLVRSLVLRLWGRRTRERDDIFTWIDARSEKQGTKDGMSFHTIMLDDPKLRCVD